MKIDTVTVTVGHKLSRNFNTANVELSVTATLLEGEKITEIEKAQQYLSRQVKAMAEAELELIAPRNG